MNAIESILNQTYTNFEFIIIDDGSTDSTINIIESCVKKDARIIFYKRFHRGIVESVNYALSKMTGDYIARMDADDVSHPKRLETEVNFLMNNHEIGVVFTQGIYIVEGKKYYYLRPKRNKDVETSLIVDNRIINSSAMISTKYLKKRKYNIAYDLMEDYHLWVTLIGVTKFYLINKPLMIRYKRKDSITGQYNKHIQEVIKQTNEIQKKCIEKNGMKLPANLYHFSAITRKMYPQDLEVDLAIKSYKFLVRQIPLCRKTFIRCNFYEALYLYYKKHKHLKNLPFAIMTGFLLKLYSTINANLKFSIYWRI